MKKNPAFTQKNISVAIFFALFLSGFSGLLYEIIFLLLANIIMGAKAASTSMVIALFLLGLSVGALLGGSLSQKQTHHKSFFILSNVLCAGLILLTLLLFHFAYLSLHWIIVLCIGSIIILLIPLFQGMNIPLATRILDSDGNTHSTGFVYFANTIGSVLGALVSGLMILPLLGFQGALIIGILCNILAALILACLNFRKIILFRITTILVLGLGTLFCFFKMSKIGQETGIIRDIYLKKSLAQHERPITPIFSVISPYQNILIAESEEFGKEMYLNGEIQVTEKDSEKYHEFLILPAIAAHPHPKSLLIAGEGDGGGLYQALKYPFKTIDHVELDEKVIQVSKEYLKDIHKEALSDKRIHRYIMDARQFIRKTKDQSYDIIILAFPDPYTLELSALFSREFYQECKRILSQDGIIVLQSGDINATNGPNAYLKAQACILNTLRSVFPHAYLYRTAIPSWGYNTFIIASRNKDPRIPRNLEGLSGKWYSQKNHREIFQLNAQIAHFLDNNKVEINTLFNPILHFYMQPNYYWLERS